MDDAAAGACDVAGGDATGALSVAQLPALVREVDVVVQTLVASPPVPGSRDALELCASLVTRADEVATFCASLRPGPLEAIVRKQVRRIEVAVQLLQAPASTARRNSFLGLQAALPRVAPVSAAHRPLLAARRHKNEVRITRAPKPIYKWERRRVAVPQRGSGSFPSGGAQHQPGAFSAEQKLRTELRQCSYVDQDSLEASMVLRACPEPGHYLRGSTVLSSESAPGEWILEFQVVLTEEELKALKFQRRRLEAEQRHLQRQQQQPHGQ